MISVIDIKFSLHPALEMNGTSNSSAAFESQEFLFRSNAFPSPIDVSSFDIDMSELDLQTMMSTMYGEDDDDDNSISAMEFAYPEESHTI